MYVFPHSWGILKSPIISGQDHTSRAEGSRWLPCLQFEAMLTQEGGDAVEEILGESAWD
jgi:hypothetical protein